MVAPMAHDVDETRSRLLEAAGEVFAEKGFQAATVREICEDMGLNGPAGVHRILHVLIEATLKIIRRRKNVIELHSANRRYPPIIFKGKDRKKVRVVGKYVGLIRLN